VPRPNLGPRLKSVDGRPNLYIVWYENGRERFKSTGTSNSRDAEAALAEFIRQRRAPRGPDDARDPGEVLIAEALDLYGTQRAPDTADPARIGYAIAALLPFWGERKVSEITRENCKAYGKARARAPATIRRELGTLNAAVTHGVNEHLLTRAVLATLPPKPEGKDRWLTRSEAARLLNAARGGRSDVRLYLPLFVVLALYTGARKEAILSLRWPQVDFEQGRINFRRNVTDDGKQEGRAATNKRRAHIPIPRRLMTFLRLAYRRRSGDLGFVVHDKGRPIKDIGAAWDGTPDAYIQGSFGRACKRAGLVDVSPHTLRHTCGTWLAQAGVDLHKIGGWLGHTDARTTQLYAHHHPDYQDEARSALDRRR
jgi:integrase